MAELAAGLVLAAWLAASGLGAAAAGRLGRHRAVWSSGMLAMPLLGLLAVGGVQEALPFPLSVVPAAFAAGVVFVAPFSGARASKVYILEAMGACTGGALFLLLSPVLLAVHMTVVAFGISSLSVALSGSAAAGAAGLLAASAAVLTGMPGVLARDILESTMTGFTEVRAYPSPYGEVVLAKRLDQFSVFMNGILETSWPSREAAETRLAAPLLSVMPERVLYIGSSPEEASMVEGWPGVETTDVVVPDDALLRAVEGFPADARSGDGRAFLSSRDREYDLVIVSTGPPLSLLANRFYTSEFFGTAMGSVREGGAVAVFLEGGANRLSTVEAGMAASVLRAASDETQWQLPFPSGGVTLLCGSGSAPPADAALLAARLDSLDTPMVFMTPGTVLYDLSDMRRDELLGELQHPDAPANRDLDPAAFRLATESWEERMGSGGGVAGTIVLAGLLVSLVLVALSSTGPPGVLLPVSLASTGLTGLGVEVTAILGVQATLGYSWTMVGAITGLFYAGSAAGAWLAPRAATLTPARAQAVSALSAAACAGAGMLYGAGILEPRLFAAVLLAALLPAGAASGIAFTGAVRKVTGGGGTAGTARTAGMLNLASCAGSMAGALALPLVLFPELGAVEGMMAVAVLGAVSTLFGRRGEGGPSQVGQ
jgi:spermidine synthase